MRRHLWKLTQQDRRDLIVYGWLLAVSIGVVVTLAAVFAQISGRHRAQAQTNAQTCAEVNYVADYLNIYFAAATPTQLRIEQGIIDKAFPVGQVREVLDGILEAEIANPSLAGLHPFNLPDLPCTIRIPVSGSTGTTGATSSSS